MSAITFAKYLAASRVLRPTARRVVTLDIDGTTFDPWACCGIKGNFRASKTCTHVRQDTLAEVQALADATGAEVVVLSWRTGLTEVTREWLEASTELRPTAYFIPGSPDDISAPFMAEARRLGGSQAAFKVATVLALQAQGVEIVGGWDDNIEVVAALRKLNVPMTQVARLVKVESWEWAAGRIGAPKPGAGRRQAEEVWFQTKNEPTLGELADRPRWGFLKEA